MRCRAERWVAARWPGVYTVLWFWGLVRNEPPQE